MGGAAEHHFRVARPGIDDLPWGTFDVRDYAPETVDAARASWTESALTEYRAVVAFSDVLRTMCEAGAPLDLIGMASSFVADEVVHVELTCRMAMELGGAVERPVDYDALYERPDVSLSPFERANETVMRVSCIAEAFSGHMAVAALRPTTHPLTRAVLGRIAADESLHYRLGALYFEWACDAMDEAERARLSRVAARTLHRLAPTLRPRRDPASARYRTPVRQIHEIGWIESRYFAHEVATAVRESIVAPLASYGIMVPEAEVCAALGG